MFTKPNKPTQSNKWIHLFQPGDMIIQYGYSKSEIPANKIRQYLIYNKEERCTLSNTSINTYEGFKVVSSGLSWEDKD